MPLPTLLVQGNLKDPKGRPAVQKKFDKYERPIDYIIERYKNAWNKAGASAKIYVLKAQTASGKSTANVAEVFKECMLGSPEQKLMLVTQPKVITAINNISQITEFNEPIIETGRNIGWSTGSNKNKPVEKPAILSATIGTLTQQLKNWDDEKFISTYRFIMIDEVHERSIDIDTTLAMLKNVFERNKNNPDFPFIVLMSATLDPEVFLDYYGIPEDNFIFVSGASNEIVEHWDIEEPVRNLAGAIKDTVHKICTDVGKDDLPEEADVLVFLPGAQEITLAYGELGKLNEDLGGDFSLLKIEGRAVREENEDYKKAFYPAGSYTERLRSGKEFKPKRRVILSTSVAETGLTLDNLKYALDAGFNKEIEFNPHYGINILATKPAPKSRITQRRGRVGRKFAGHFFPLYPKSLYDQFPRQQKPEIVIQDIMPAFIGLLQDQMKSLKGKEFALEKLDMVTRIPTDFLISACNRAYKLGLISPRIKNDPEAFDLDFSDTDTPEKILSMLTHTKKVSYGITPIGLIMNKFGMYSMESFRMILAGFSWDVSITDLATIAAYLELSPRDFALSMKKQPRWDMIFADSKIGSFTTYDQLKLIISDDFIKGIVLYSAISQKMASGKTFSAGVKAVRDFCEKAQIKEGGVMTFIQIREEIIEQCINAGLGIFAHEDKTLREADKKTFMTIIIKLKHCIYDGYKCNYLMHIGDGRYAGIGAIPVNVPRTIGHEGSFPQYVLFDKLSSKQDPKSGLYIITTDRISMMSGYVSIDRDFYT